MRLLSPENRQLLAAIENRKPSSVADLARMVGRAEPNVSRNVGEGIKVGVGYNFTTYSDDLTDLSYRSRGWLVNLLGTM